MVKLFASKHVDRELDRKVNELYEDNIDCAMSLLRDYHNAGKIMYIGMDDDYSDVLMDFVLFALDLKDPVVMSIDEEEPMVAVGDKESWGQFISELENKVENEEC